MSESEKDSNSLDLETVPPSTAPGTAAEKIASTLREISRPGEDAGEQELMLATIAMGLEQGLAGELARTQATGELDEFVLALTRFLAIHRSDDAKQLVVVELPPHTVRPELAHGNQFRERVNLPPGTRLQLLDEAIAAAGEASWPFS